MKPLLLLALLGACTINTDDDKSQHQMWVCYTHALCDGDIEDMQHHVCAAPSPDDKVFPGDAAAHDWSALWTAGCFATQATGPERGTCLQERPGDPKPGAPATWACTVTCEPTYEGC